MSKTPEEMADKYFDDNYYEHDVLVETKISIILGYLAGYQAGLAAERWIDVKERLPDESGRYLVRDKIPFVCDYYTASGFDWSAWDSNKIETEIQYWCQLPAAPTNLKETTHHEK